MYAKMLKTMSVFEIYIQARAAHNKKFFESCTLILELKPHIWIRRMRVRNICSEKVCISRPYSPEDRQMKGGVCIEVHPCVGFACKHYNQRGSLTSHISAISKSINF